MRITHFVLSICLCAFKVEVNKDASFRIKGENGFYLESGDYMIRSHYEAHSTKDGSLIIDRERIKNGSDILGNYTEHSFNVTLTNYDGFGVSATVREYSNFLVFRQKYDIGLLGMSTGDIRKVTTAFPSVKVPSKSKSQFINPCDDMGGWLKLKKGSWNTANMTHMCGVEQTPEKPTKTTEAGPFFIYDQANSTLDYDGQIFVISAFSKFTVHYTEVNQENNQLWFGLPGTADEIPKGGFDIETIISYSNQGFYEGIQEWGKKLRSRYGKTDDRRESDATINYLSYWTNQGAFYYYNTEPNKNYADTMIDIYSKTRYGETNAPFRSWNYDSWWYPKCPNKGVKQWTPMKEVFPDGMSPIFEKTSMPVIAHNKWWCNETDYAIRNGGNYKFRFDDEHGTAVPVDELFWSDLFKNSTQWGLDVYLQAFGYFFFKVLKPIL